MQLTLTRGIEIFTALGRKTAARWGTKQLIAAINSGLSTVATPEALAKIADPTIVADITALMGAADVTVVEGELPAPASTEPAPAPAAAKGKGKGKAKPTAAATEAPAAGAPVEAPAAETAPAAAPAAAKGKGKGKGKTKTEAAPAAAETAPAAAPAAAKEPKPPRAPSIGVRFTRSRPFICGMILAKYGANVGVTDAMVAEVDAEYGEANERETLFALRNAWHAVRGYCGWADAAQLLAAHELPADSEAPAGVRYTDGRSYVSGQVIAELGIRTGVGDKHIERITELYGSNPSQDSFALRNAWHSIRGYYGWAAEADIPADVA